METMSEADGGGRPLRVKVALVTLLDPRGEFYDNYQRAKGMDLKEQHRSSHLSAQEPLGGCDLVDLGVIEGKEEVYRAAAVAAAESCAGMVVNMPGWAPPGWAGVFSSVTGLPVLVYAPFALSGPMAMRGELEALGAEHMISLGEPEKLREFLDRAGARQLLSSLRGKRFASVGGLGMDMHYAEIASTSALLDFGVEILHIDGAGILGRAEKMQPARLGTFLARLEKMAAGCPGRGDAVLGRQVSFYLALKDILEEEGADFASVKCQPEFSDLYGCLCFAPAFLPLARDPEGTKKMVPVSCEGDFFASLAGFLLMLLSGETPLFCDFIIPLYEEGLLALQNCGGAPTCYAGGAADGLSGVRLAKNIQGQSGSWCFDFSAREMESVTLLGLGKRLAGYWAGTCRGEVVRREELRPLLMDWPTLFLKVENARDCLRRFFSQHVMLVPGDHLSLLEQLAREVEAMHGS